MSVHPAQISAEQYLARERAAETRSEFIAGQIYAMTGASRKHNAIVVNIITGIQTQINRANCEAFVNDMRVRIQKTGAYLYPDIVVGCAPLRFEGANQDNLLNPSVVFEVLSPSTEGYDRGLKLRHYRALDSLVDYILVSQEEPALEWYHHQGDGSWIHQILLGQEATLALEAIDCRLTLAAIYAGVL